MFLKDFIANASIRFELKATYIPTAYLSECHKCVLHSYTWQLSSTNVHIRLCLKCKFIYGHINKIQELSVYIKLLEAFSFYRS